MTPEGKIKKKVTETYKADGWLVIRIVVSGTVGVPDLLLCHPTKGVKMIEVKSETGRLSPAQVNFHQKLRMHGMTVEVVNHA